MTIYTVDPGATSSGLTLNPGDEVFVLSGGSASGTIVNLGGTETVSAAARTSTRRWRSHQVQK